MKALIRLLVAALTVLSAHAQSNVYSLNVVGYVNHLFGVGDNLFANPLHATNDVLSTLFQYSSVPDGTTVSLWNPSTRAFDATSTYELGAWSLDFTLSPGTGARLTTPSLFTNTFVGEVQSHDGGPFLDDQLTPPPLFGGPNGIYLLADKAPVANTGTNIFLNILGRLPNVGEQVITLNTTSTYLGGGNWDLEPTLGVSDAAFLNVGPVPEPATATLGLLGWALLQVARRRRSSAVGRALK
jgi:hypothetical protein